MEVSISAVMIIKMYLIDAIKALPLTLCYTTVPLRLTLTPGRPNSAMKAGDPRILSLYSRRCAENRTYTDSLDESCSCGRPKPTRSTPLGRPMVLQDPSRHRLEGTLK